MPSPTAEWTCLACLGPVAKVCYTSVPCSSLSRASRKGKEVGETVKATLKPKAGFQTLVQCTVGTRISS